MMRVSDDGDLAQPRKSRCRLVVLFAIQVVIGGVALHIVRDEVTGKIHASTERGEELPLFEVYWSAWQAFYPDIGLYSV